MCTCVSMVSTTKAAMQEQQTSLTPLGCSSQPRFQILFKNNLWVFCHLSYTPILSLMEDIATRWKGLSHCLGHYTIHFQQIINANSKFSMVGGVS